jgi:hypothetical protein
MTLMLLFLLGCLALGVLLRDRTPNIKRAIVAGLSLALAAGYYVFRLL